MKPRSFIAILLIVCTGTHAQAYQKYVFERADVLTRPKLTDLFDVDGQPRFHCQRSALLLAVAPPEG